MPDDAYTVGPVDADTIERRHALLPVVRAALTQIEQGTPDAVLDLGYVLLALGGGLTASVAGFQVAAEQLRLIREQWLGNADRVRRMAN